MTIIGYAKELIILAKNFGEIHLRSQSRFTYANVSRSLLVSPYGTFGVSSLKLMEEPIVSIMASPFWL